MGPQIPVQEVTASVAQSGPLFLSGYTRWVPPSLDEVVGLMDFLGDGP